MRPENIWAVWSPFVIGAGLSALGLMVPLIRDSLRTGSAIIGITISSATVVELIKSFILGFLLFFPGFSLMAVMMKSGVSDIATGSRALKVTRTAIAWNIGAALCCLEIAFSIWLWGSWWSILWVLLVLLAVIAVWLRNVWSVGERVQLRCWCCTTLSFQSAARS